MHEWQQRALTLIKAQTLGVCEGSDGAAEVCSRWVTARHVWGMKLDRRDWSDHGMLQIPSNRLWLYSLDPPASQSSSELGFVQYNAVVSGACSVAFSPLPPESHRKGDDSSFSVLQLCCSTASDSDTVRIFLNCYRLLKSMSVKLQLAMFEYLGCYSFPNTPHASQCI